MQAAPIGEGLVAALALRIWASVSMRSPKIPGGAAPVPGNIPGIYWVWTGMSGIGWERFCLETSDIASILASSGTGWEQRLAEGVGFEPTRDLATPGGFQDRCLKPLGHPSNSLSWLSFSNDPLSPKAILPLNCHSNFLATLGPGEDLIDPLCGPSLHTIHEVGVKIHGDGDRGVAEPFLHDLR